jgi:hypothetical protein
VKKNYTSPARRSPACRRPAPATAKARFTILRHPPIAVLVPHVPNAVRRRPRQPGVCACLPGRKRAYPSARRHTCARGG